MHRFVHTILLRLRSVFQRTRVERELNDELSFHLAMEERELIARGVAPDEARAEALRRFGSPTAMADACRDERGVQLLDELRQDVRFAVRTLAKLPVVTLTVILTLGIGIAANTTVFAFVDATLLARLRVPHPEQLFLIIRQSGSHVSESVPYPFYATLRHRQTMGIVSGYAFRDVAVRDDGNPVTGQLTDEQFFSVLGVRMQRGRWWGAADLAESDRLVVISDRYWAKRFGRSDSAVGARLFVNGEPFTIIGVLAAEFDGVSLDFPTQIWMPLSNQALLDGAPLLADPSENWLRLITRLSDPDSLVRQRTVSQAFRTYRHDNGLTSTGQPPEELVLVSGSRPAFRGRAAIAAPATIALCIAATVLLIACSNVANLQLARGLARRRELTVRVALGASRRRLVRQLATESVVLGMAGGVIGILLARAAIGAASDYLSSHNINGPLPASFGQPSAVLVVLFAIGAATVATAFFGLTPAVRATRLNVVAVLAGDSRTSTAGHAGWRNPLLIGQLALSLVLLIGAALFVRTFRFLSELDLGFNYEQLVQVRFDPRGLSSDDRRLRVTDFARSVSQMPGVNAVALGVPPLFGRASVTTNVEPGDRRGESRFSAEIVATDSAYFTTLNVKLSAGRRIASADTRMAMPVALLNQTAARLWFPEGLAVGRRLFVDGQKAPITVVGVIRDMRLHGVMASPQPTVVLPLSQTAADGINPGLLTVFIRADGKRRAAVMREVELLDPSLRPAVQVVDELIRDDIVVKRFQAAVAVSVAAFGLLLAAIGTFGLQSYLVTQRVREIGVRVALGATPSEVAFAVWRRGMTAAVIAVLIGLGLGALASEVVRHQLFGITALDPIALSSAVLILLVVSAVANYLPARRAARLDPILILRD